MYSELKVLKESNPCLFISIKLIEPKKKIFRVLVNMEDERKANSLTLSL